MAMTRSCWSCATSGGRRGIRRRGRRATRPSAGACTGRVAACRPAAGAETDDEDAVGAQDDVDGLLAGLGVQSCRLRWALRMSSSSVAAKICTALAECASCAAFPRVPARPRNRAPARRGTAGSPAVPAPARNGWPWPPTRPPPRRIRRSSWWRRGTGAPARTRPSCAGCGSARAGLSDPISDREYGFVHGEASGMARKTWQKIM